MTNNTSNEQMGHCRQELSSWLRALDYLQQENVYLRNYLGNITKSASDGLLEKIEHYQNLLINKDALIMLMRHDIAKHAKQLENQHDGIPAEVIRTQQKLAAEMEKIEKELGSWKYEFYDYFGGTR